MKLQPSNTDTRRISRKQTSRAPTPRPCVGLSPCQVHIVEIARRSAVDATATLTRIFERGLTMKCTNSATIYPQSVTGQTDRNLLHYVLLAIIFVSALILSPHLNAQATGSFAGNVLDKSGSALPGATVTATSDETGLARETKTDSAGHYLIPLRPVGTYTVRVDSTGFQSAESKGLHLQVDQARELDFSVVPEPPGRPKA